MNGKWSEYGLKAAGALVAALGIVVLVGWATHSPALVQLIPASSEMRRNTAFGLLVCGFGIMWLGGRRKMPALLAGAFCALLGVLTGLEWAFDLNLRIDDLLGKSYFPGETLPYGRMSPITTVCFMLAGLAILFSRSNVRRRFRSWISGVLASVLAAIGLVTSMGYIFGNTNAYGWGDLTRIAFTTALAFALAGLCLLTFLWSHESEPGPAGSARDGWRPPEWFPFSAGIGVLSATLGAWQALKGRSSAEQPLLSEIVFAGGVVLALLGALVIHRLQRGKGSPETTMMAGFGLAFATLMAVGIVQNRSVRALVEADRWVEHTRAVRTELEEVCSAILQGESGTRGYVVTGLPDYLAQQQAGIDRSEEHLHALRGLIANPRVRRDLDTLEALTRRKTAMMHYLAGLRRDRGFRAASRFLGTEEPLRLMNEIRAQVDSMEDEEGRLLEARQAASRTDARKSNAAIALGTLLALSFVVAAGWITRRDALGRERAEDQLRGARQDWEEIFQAIGQLAMILDPEQRILAVNRATLKTTGMSESELLGRKCYEVFHGATQAPPNCPYGKMCDSHCTETSEMEVQIMGRTCLVTCTPVFDDKHKLVKAIHLATDITDRKRAENARALLGAIVESSDDAIISTNLDGVIVSWNRGAERLYGHAFGDVIGRSPGFLVPADRLNEIQSVIERIRQREEVQHFETVRVRKDGTSVHVSVTASPVRDALGKLIGTSSITRDLTERKRAEEALKAERQRLLSVLEALPPMICLLDRDHRITFANRAFRDKFGEPQGLRCYEQLFGSNAPCEFCQAYTVLETGQPRRWECPTPDGSVIDVCDVPFTDVDGSPMILEMNVDITETRRTAQALERTLAELKEAQRVGRLGTWSIDFATGQTHWSEELYRILGLPPSSPLPPFDEQSRFFTPETWTALNAQVAQCRRDGMPYEIETETVAVNGTHGWQIARGEPVLDAQGTITGLRGITMDITERKRAEEAQRRSEAELKEAQRVARLGSWTFDVKSGHVVWSDQLFRMLGLDAAVGAPRYPEQAHLYTPESWSILKRAVDDALQRGVPYEVELEMARADRTTGWMLVRGEAVRNSEGCVAALRGIVMDITERKQAEKMRSRLAAVVESSAVAIESVNLDGIVTSWNPGAERLYGFAAEEAIGKPVSIIAPPELAGDVERSLQQIARSEEVQQVETLRLRKDGSRVSVAATISPVKDAQGRVVGASSVAFDITERKQAEEALRKHHEELEQRVKERTAELSDANAQIEAELAERKRTEIESRAREQRLRLATDAAQLGVFEWSVQPDTAVWENKRMYEIFGIPETTDPVNRDRFVRETVHPEDLSRFEQELGESMRTGAMFLGAYRIRRLNDGQWRWIQYFAKFEMGADGKPIRLLGVLQDITERKQAEEALRKSEERLRLAQQAGRVGTFEWNLQTDRDVWTPELESLYGLREGEFAQTGAAWADLIHPEDRANVLRLCEQSLRTGAPTVGEWRVTWPDGGVHWLTGRWQVFRDDFGKPLRMTGVNIDITERKEAEQALRESESRERARAQELEALMEAVPLGIFRCHDTECRWMDGNRAAYELLRRPPGSNLAKFAPEGERPANFRAMRNGSEIPPSGLCIPVAAATGQSFRGEEMDLVFEDGVTTSIVGNIEPLLDESGRPRGAVGAFLDVTELKRAEAALRQSEQRLRLATQVAGIGTFEWNVETGVNTWTRELEAIYGLDPGEFGRTQAAWEQLVHPEDRAAAVKLVERAFETGEPMEGQWRVARRDGSTRWVFGCFQVFKDAAGASRSLIGANIDITERKRAEEELERRVAERTAQLVESNAQLETVTSNAPIILFATDAEGVFTVHTGKAVAASGRKPGDLVGTHYRDLMPERAEAVEDIRRALAGESSIETFENAIGNAFETHYGPLKDSDGNVIGMIGVSVDITERKRAEAAQQRVEANLSALIESTDDLIWSVDLNYQLLTFNRALRDNIEKNYGVQIALGMGPDDLLGPARGALWPPMYAHTLAEGPFHVEYTLRDGRLLELTFNLIVEKGRTTGVSVFGKDITEHKRAEQALQQSEAAFRTLANAMPQMVWACTPDGLNVYFNDRWVEYTGLTLEESYGRGWNTPFHPDDQQPAWAAWNHSTATGEIYKIESRLRAADGSYRWFLMRGVPMRDAEGNTVKWFGTCTDIEDLKRSEDSLSSTTEALRRASAYNRSLLEASLDPLVTIAPDGKLTDVNAAAEQVTGFSRQELIGTDFSDYFTNPGKARSGYQKVFRDGQVRDYELEVRHRDGHLTPVLYNASLYRGEPGEVVGVFAAARDITETRRAQQQVAAERQRFNSILDVMPAYVVLLSPDYHVPFANRFFEGRFGQSHGKRCFEYLFGRTSPCEICHSFEPFKTNEPVNWFWTGPDGRDYDIYDFPFTDSDGSRLVLEMGIDVTERNRAEAEIKELNAGLERRVAERTTELATANQELEAFTYSVAHDLRAPLRGMDGFSLALVEDYGPRLDEQAQDYIHKIRKASTRMAQLIDDLLNLSRISRTEVRREKVDLSTMAMEVVAELRRSSPEREERVQVRIASSLEVEGDPHLLRVVLENLLGNAWKFSARRRPARIELGTVEHDGGQAYFVRDNGVGFDMTFANKLFAPFQRLHSAADFPGTGIGLVTVARIVRKHGGEVWAESTVDKGATFYFTLGEVNS